MKQKNSDVLVKLQKMFVFTELAYTSIIFTGIKFTKIVLLKLKKTSVVCSEWCFSHSRMT